jgi:V-type H+-transporting ATPase subunit E
VSGEVRVRKMQARDELVQKVKKAAVQKLASHATANQASYAELLKKLVVQGLIKLNESRVEVQCREVDVRIVQKVLEPAAREYERMILDACKETVRVEVVLQDSKYLPGPAAGDGALACAGGVKMSAKHGRIMLDNTLDARLGIAFDDLMWVGVAAAGGD